MGKLWFKAKQYGWGWYPCSWEGWMVTVLFALSIALLATHLHQYTSTKDGMLLYFSALFSLAGLLMIIAYKKGERPRWRWGEVKK